MHKIIWLLKRKPGISFDDFRNHYENSHAVLGQKYFGHLLIDYHRNYAIPAETNTLLRNSFEFDCITEWTLPNAAALDEIFTLLAEPAIGRLFDEDEEHFLDRESITLIHCDPRDTGSGSAASALANIAAARKLAQESQPE